MKEYFYEKENNAYIIDDKEGLLVRENKDNIEETLVVENNIEQIETELNDIKDARMQKKLSLKMSSICFTGISIISILIFAILGRVAFDVSLLSISAMAIMAFMGVQIYDRIDSKKELKGYEACIKEVEIDLEKEKNKLKQLQLEGKSKTIDATIIKEIPKAEIVAKLTRKREIIFDYMKKKKKYNSLYQNGTLDSFLQSKNYSESDIELVKTIMQEETKQEEIIKNSKQKIK